MRISDWSSDVCSSDLDGGHLLPVADDLVGAEHIMGIFITGGHWSSCLDDLPGFLHVKARPFDEVGEVCFVEGKVAECSWRSVCIRSEEHTSELQSLMRISYAVFCLKKKRITSHKHT